MSIHVSYGHCIGYIVYNYLASETMYSVVIILETSYRDTLQCYHMQCSCGIKLCIGDIMSREVLHW